MSNRNYLYLYRNFFAILKRASKSSLFSIEDMQYSTVGFGFTEAVSNAPMISESPENNVNTVHDKQLLNN